MTPTTNSMLGAIRRTGRSTEAIRMAMIGALTLGITAAVGVGALPADGAAHARDVVAHSITFGSPKWQVGLPLDGVAPIAMSSPNVAELPGGPAVVVGDELGDVYSFNLATGVKDWTYLTVAPVNSSPSVAALTPGSDLDTVFVGTGDAGDPLLGGYQAITPTGGDKWLVQETNPSTDSFIHNGVQASLAVGDLQGSTDVTAGSLGQEQDSVSADSGAVLRGFPWFQADSDFTTPALADLYGNGQTEIVEGGDSTAAANVYGEAYQNGGHLRILSPNGNAGQSEPNGGLDCQYNTDETVQSSPAVGEFFGSSSTVGIVFGTGATYHQSDTDKLFAVDSHCNLIWSAALNGNTKSSPALADVMGNGQLQVVEGTDTGTTGSVYALNGATGATLWSTRVGRVIGSVVTADLGSGYQDVLAPTINGVVVLDGKTGSVIATLQPNTGFQNSPLVTDDPNGTIGITLAGYQATNSVIYHYEIAGSNGSLVHETGAWPQFHHDPQLTGDAGTPQPNIEVPCNAPAGGPHGYFLSASDGGIFKFGNLPFCGSTGGIVLNKPIVGMAATPDGGGYWEVASDGGIFSFGDAKFYGSTGDIALNRPIVGMAATPDGKGYWLVASDGGIFSFGDAKYFGSTGAIHLNRPIVGLAATPDGKGYWLVASDGGIFSFGDAKFYGSTGAIHLNRPIVGLAASHDGKGYWLVASDGGIFSFGDAKFYGSTGAIHLNAPIVGMAGISAGNGYRFVAADGGIFNFGAAEPYGSEGGQRLNKPIVAMAGF